MRELKPYIGPHPTDHTLTEYYLKSEADRVIAELKAQKAQAEDDCAYWKFKAHRARHHKYKRCLAMAYAEWLKQMSLCNYPDSILYRRAARRERKWKEMAQKFKEADDGKN